MAVLLITSTPDSASAPCHESCHKSGMSQRKAKMPSVPRAIVSTTCSSPKPSTWRRMARSLGRLNSSPITNIKKTTPNSASQRTLALV